MKTDTTLLFALGSVLLLACSTDPKLPPMTPETSKGITNDKAQQEAPAPVGEINTSNIVLDPKIVKLCDIPTAHFAFDSSSLTREAQTALDALALCFTTGNAKGEGLRIVGNTDPRGETEYNLGLGQRRAGAVEEYLVAHGVSDERVASSSRGELDAVGFDDRTWAIDRNVAIFLASSTR